MTALKLSSITVNLDSRDAMKRMKESLSKKKGFRISHNYFIDILDSNWKDIEKLILKKKNKS